MKYEITLEEDGRFALYESYAVPPTTDGLAAGYEVRRQVGGDKVYFDSEPEARAALEIWVQLRLHFKLGLVSGVFRYGFKEATVKWEGNNTFQSTTIRPVNDGAMGAYVAGLIEEPF